VRWLSNEVAPSVELLQHGISVDRRVLVQRGDIEMARWILEQSVSITTIATATSTRDPNRSARDSGLSARGLNPRYAVENLGHDRRMLARLHGLQHRSDAGGREVDPVIGDAVGNDEDVTVRQRPTGVDHVGHVAVLLFGGRGEERSFSAAIILVGSSRSKRTALML